MIAITQSPQQPVPSANKAIYIVSGDNVASGNFRYVADVSGARLKCDKLPNNLGFFNVSEVIKTLIVPAKPNPVAGWQDADVAEAYSVEFKEEFGIPPTVQSGSTNASGIVWKAYFPQQNIPATSGYMAVSGVGTFQALTNRPTYYSLKTGQNDWISVLKDRNNTPFVAEIQYPTRTFQASSIDIGYSAMFNVGAVRLLTSGQTSDGKSGEVNYPKTRDEAWAFYQARATADGAVSETNPCAKAEYDELVPNMPFGEETYIVQFIAPIGDSDEFSQVFTITIDDCERYPSQIVYFRNALGGVDPYDFKMKNRKRLEVERSIYNRNSDIYGTTSFDTIWQNQYTERLELNSDWLTDSEWLWLKEMFLTNECWVLQDGALVEAVIVPTEYRVNKRAVDRLQQLNVTIDIAYKNTTV